VLKCVQCGAKLDLTASSCPACGHDVEMGRLTGILGVVCRNCDAYNEPGAKTCVSCGQPFAKPAAPPPPSVPPPAPAAPGVRVFTKPAPAPAPQGVKPAPAPIPLVPACPGCGEEPGPGQYCQRCGRPLGARGTLVATPAAPEPGQHATAQAFGPADAGKTKLILERGEGNEGATFPLDAGEVGAGRSRGAITFPDDACLAPLQATFFHRDGALHVRDEGAPGGVFMRLRGLSVPLKPGDLVCVGDRLLRFAGPLPAAPPPPPDATRRLGSPRPQETAVLLEEWLEGGLGGRVYLRAAPSVTIGRAGCSVNLGDDPYLSQAHAEIVVEADGSAKLRDLGSSNGTFLRIPARAERMLHDGDMLRLGREVLRVSIA
jgi:ribosomal protein L40E